MNRRPPIALPLRLFGIGLLLLAGHADAAKTFRWVDDEGVTVFSQTPPRDREAEAVKSRPPRPSNATTERARDELRSMQERAESSRQQRVDARDERRAARQGMRERARNCEAARHNLKTYRDLAARRVVEPDGRVVTIDEETRAARIAEAERGIAEWCP